MKSPAVSVVIPAYNQAEFLADAIQSVLDQSLPDFEVIVVNDASPDRTDEVVGQFSDPRMRYIVHERNRGLPAARNTGIRASSGEIIALLDADDMFHPEKLASHVEFLERHPAVSVTYNPRFEVDPDGELLALWRPPLVVSLPDLVMGFPFAPSDMVVRREPLFHIGLFDESYRFFSEDLDITCRLVLAGFEFASVDRALNYRRFYPDRVISNVPQRVGAALKALEATFADPRCTSDVLALRNSAIANTFMIWSYEAFIGNESELAQELLRRAVRFDPSILANGASRLLEFLVSRSVRDGGDHDLALGKVFGQLPSELLSLASSCDWTVAHGHLRRGIRSAIAGDRAGTLRHLEAAVRRGARFDEPFLRLAAHQVLSHERERESHEAGVALQNLVHCLERIGPGPEVRSLQALYSINRAFQEYRGGRPSQVPARVVDAIMHDPSYLTNRGALAILLRSVLHLAPGAEARSRR